jgi:hypothetical protein
MEFYTEAVYTPTQTHTHTVRNSFGIWISLNYVLHEICALLGYYAAES